MTLYDDLSWVESIASQTLTDGTVDGTAANLANQGNAQQALAVIDVGAWTDGTHTFTVQEAEDDGSGSPDTWGTAAAAKTQGTNPVVVDGATDDDQTYYVGLTYPAEHVRVTVTTTGSSTGLAEAQAYVVSGKAAAAPVR